MRVINLNTDFSRGFSESYLNVIGSGCGLRPIGIGKNHKEKLERWRECNERYKEAKSEDALNRLEDKDTKRDIKNEKKGAKVSEKQSEANLNNALAQATVGPTSSGGMSTGAMIGIGVGAALILALGITAVVKFTSRAKATAPAAA